VKSPENCILTGKTILILSTERWGVNFVSKHHYAKALAHLGNKVFFFNPPVPSLLPPKIQHREVDYQLTELTMSVLPGLNRLPFSLRSVVHRFYAERIIKAIGHSIDIVWSFNPFVFQNLSAFKARYSVFHAVDYHAGPMQFETASHADVLFTASDRLMSQFAHLTLPRLNLGHGLAEWFVNPPTIREILPSGSGATRVGYVGNLSNQYIDRSSVASIVQQNLTVDFYFIGPSTSSNLHERGVPSDTIDWLSKKANVFLLGERKSDEIPALLNQMDALLVAYDTDKYPMEASNSHKILEYLSTGKPIISSPIEEYRNSALLITSESSVSLPAKFKEVIGQIKLHQGPDQQRARREYALQHRYQMLIQKVCEKLSEL
jgi:glycosyltransferase involved in cell wall biosynthesis